MNLKVLLKKQGMLDNTIRLRTGIVRQRNQKNEMALLVELGELANEVQSFKYWKLNKTIDFSKIKEEWADCLHFALMIERVKRNVRHTVDTTTWFDELPQSLIDDDEAITEAFSTAFDLIINRKDISPIKTIIRLGYQLGMTDDEMVEEYNKKWEKNLKRQKDKY